MPTIRASVRRRLLPSVKTVLDSCIVPDDFASEDEVDFASAVVLQNYERYQDFEKTQHDLKPWIHWQHVFKSVYMDITIQNRLETNSVSCYKNITELVDTISYRVRQGIETEALPMTSL